MTYTKITPEIGASYLEWDDNGVIRFIPMDESNSDYQAYLASLDGNTPTGLGSPTDPTA